MPPAEGEIVRPGGWAQQGREHPHHDRHAKTHYDVPKHRVAPPFCCSNRWTVPMLEVVVLDEGDGLLGLPPGTVIVHDTQTLSCVAQLPLDCACLPRLRRVGETVLLPNGDGPPR